MGTLNITQNYDNSSFINYDIRLFYQMVDAFITKNYYRNISEYNVEYNPHDGLITVNFFIRNSFDVHDLNEKLENIILLVNCDRKPQLNMNYYTTSTSF